MDLCKCHLNEKELSKEIMGLLKKIIIQTDQESQLDDLFYIKEILEHYFE
jgi:hypothetical protein